MSLDLSGTTLGYFS